MKFLHLPSLKRKSRPPDLFRQGGPGHLALDWSIACIPSPAFKNRLINTDKKPFLSNVLMFSFTSYPISGSAPNMGKNSSRFMASDKLRGYTNDCIRACWRAPNTPHSEFHFTTCHFEWHQMDSQFFQSGLLNTIFGRYW